MLGIVSLQARLLVQGVHERGLLCLLRSLEVKVRPRVLLLFPELCSLQAGLLQVLADAVPVPVLRDLGQGGEASSGLEANGQC